ncbi:hypothetical protein EDC04DRAFT_2734401 [Pisolithus marmoratus]|nr:hypothetical protein EDC04DRAFT_2734401 [Pisolithus marmoratus]
MITYLSKSANEWTSDTTLPLPFVDSEILTARTADDTIDVASYTFLSQLELAMIHEEGGSFSVVLFSLGYARRPRIIRSMWLPFFTCCELKHAKLDVCVINCDANAIVLLLKQGKQSGSDKDTCPQLDMNSGRRAAGFEVLDSMVFLVVRTSPSFFKIPVTHELAQCVETGTFPDNLTIVTGHVPDIPRPHFRFSEGMEPLDNRRAILRCYELSKNFFFDQY